HRVHRVEFKMDALAAGHYIFSHVPLNTISDYYYDLTLVQVSNIAVMAGTNYRQKDQLNVVVDRNTGAPQENVKSQIYSINYGKTEYYSKHTSYTSDKNGFLNYNLKNGLNYFATYTKGNDILIDLTTSYSYG